MTFRYVPAPATLFREIRKLPAGHFVLYHDGHLDDHVYWELPWESDPGTYRDEEEAANELISLLSDTVERHLQSEMPVGVFLSGGVDSSAILALASGAQERLASQSPFAEPGENLGLDSLSPQIAGQILAAHASRSHTSLESFTLGFAHGGVPQTGFWELDQARVTARRFGTHHHQRIVEAEVVPYDLPRILWQLEEPLGDPGVIPMFYISQMAAQAGVPVVLSGEGADELFAGYDVYLASRIVKAFRRVPSGLREHLLRPLAALIPSHMHGHNLAHRLLDPVDQWYRGVGATFTEEEKQAIYSPRMRHIASQIDMQSVVSPFFPRMNALSDNRGKCLGNDTLAAMLYFDVRSSLADDTLLKADRLTMAYSVELRVPFLDHLMVEFAATLPPEFKLAGHTLKYILKKALGNVLPAEILYRKKLGFTAPVTAWMSRDLHAYAETLLTSSRFRDRGYFDDRSIRHLLEPARCMSDVGSRQVFTLLVLELWHRLFVDGDRDLLAAPAFEEQTDNAPSALTGDLADCTQQPQERQRRWQPRLTRLHPELPSTPSPRPSPFPPTPCPWTVEPECRIMAATGGSRCKMSSTSQGYQGCRRAGLR
ncbi:MAG: hypothetical protein IMX01_07290 [Limnochordaceae bacterium]|nr:hypothetical protein [Limnochordaceae bacterium]